MRLAGTQLCLRHLGCLANPGETDHAGTGPETNLLIVLPGTGGVITPLA